MIARLYAGPPSNPVLLSALRQTDTFRCARHSHSAVFPIARAFRQDHTVASLPPLGMGVLGYLPVFPANPVGRWYHYLFWRYRDDGSGIRNFPMQPGAALQLAKFLADVGRGLGQGARTTFRSKRWRPQTALGGLNIVARRFDARAMFSPA